MSCYVIGGPNDLNIAWYKAGKVIGLTHRTKVVTELRRSTLTIRDVLAEDEGNYTCYAAWVLYFLRGRRWWAKGNSVVKINLSICIISIWKFLFFMNCGTSGLKLKKN